MRVGILSKFFPTRKTLPIKASSTNSSSHEVSQPTINPVSSGPLPSPAPHDNKTTLSTHPTSSIPYVPHGLYPPMLYLGPKGEIPVVAVHFNDPDKNMIDEWWGKFWWNQWHVEDDSVFKLIVNNRVEGAEVMILGIGKIWRDFRRVLDNRVLN